MQAQSRAKEETDSASFPIWRISVDRYHQMIENGVFQNDPIELLNGFLIKKQPKDPKHTAVKNLIAHSLRKFENESYFVQTHMPITLEESEPEPDISMVRGNVRGFFDRHPNGNEVELVVEIFNSVDEYDSTVKKEIYASAEIPQYWIVNLIENQVEIYTDPHATTYRQKTTITKDQSLPVKIANEKWGEISLSEILP